MSMLRLSNFSFSIKFILLMLCFTLANVAKAHTLLVLGDSLSAAYGIPVEKGWVSLLSTRVQSVYPEWHIVNASISGETTSGGLARLKPLLEKHHPDLVLVELGGNDGMRGLSLSEMKHNLQTMIDQSRFSGAKIAVCSMKLPPNYGAKYVALFEQTYADITEKNAIANVPFLLEGVAGHPELIQSDGIHPIAEAQNRILENVWPSVDKVLGH